MPEMTTALPTRPTLSDAASGPMIDAAVAEANAVLSAIGLGRDERL